MSHDGTTPAGTTSSGTITRGTVLVTGASVAGPAAAYWLDRTGWEVTVVERAPELRTAGQNIDVRGLARDVADRMGVLEAIKGANTGEVGTRIVADDGSAVSEFPAADEHDGPTAELEILRGELARVLVEACGDGVEWRYGDSPTAVDEHDDGVEVTFESGRTERYDVVVVAEGAHSRTRDLVLPEPARPELRRLGVCMAYLTIPRVESDDAWWNWLQTPGQRQVHLRPDNVGTTRALLSVMHDEPVDFPGMDGDEQRAWFRERFTDVGWAAPRILSAMGEDDELYAEDLAQVVGDTWSTGRVVLLGDAAGCVTPLGGGGTSLALIGGYVLAAELSRLEPGRASAGAVSEAFDRYAAWVRPLVEKAQDLPPGTPAIAHPDSRLGVTALRTATKVAASRPVQAVVGRFTLSPTSDRTLPEMNLAGHPAG